MWNDGRDIRIFGHGTLSGDFIPHPNYANPPVRFRSLIDYFFWHSLECVQTVTMLVKLNLCSWAHLLILFSRCNRRTNSLSIPFSSSAMAESRPTGSSLALKAFLDFLVLPILFECFWNRRLQLQTCLF